MQKQEATRIIKLIAASYPNAAAFSTPEKVEAAVELWAEMFAKDEYERLRENVLRWIEANKFPPTVAELKEMIGTARHKRVVPLTPGLHNLTDAELDEMLLHALELNGTPRDFVESTEWWRSRT